MLLVDHQIKAEIMLGRVIIDPYDPTLVNPSSIDVRLGNMFGIPKPRYEVIDPLDPLSFTTEMEELNTYVLQPKSFVISCLKERVELPNDITMHVKGKSSLGRLGLENSSCAGHIDPGFPGAVTIELFNYSNYPLKLTAGMKIGQLCLFKHPACRDDYASRANSKYTNQIAGQGSKGIDRLE